MKNFGKLAKDKVTGFEGIITAKVDYMYGCAQYCLTPRVSEGGKREEAEYFDEGRIEIIGEGVTPKSVKAEKNGCDRREYPSRR